jgi:hypothetical protein
MALPNKIDLPRIADGTFTQKDQSFPELTFGKQDVPVYDPEFFLERAWNNNIEQVPESSLTAGQRTAVLNAAQAVSDAWVLENNVPEDEAGSPTDWVKTTTFQDGNLTVIHVEPKDFENTAAALIAVDRVGNIVGKYDSADDAFTPRWVPMGGLRDQILTDLTDLNEGQDF